MTIDWYSAQRDIIARLEGWPEITAAKIPVLEGNVTDDYNVPLSGTGIMPHMIVKFMGTTSTTIGQSMTGAANSNASAQFVVSSVGGTADDAHHLSQIGRNALIGYEPVGCSEIHPSFFAGVGAVSSLRTPTRYAAEQAYRTNVNATS